MTGIHPTAIVSPSAIIGHGTTIGAYSVIGDKVKIGSGNKLHNHVVMDGNTTIGDNNEFFPFCSVGHRPQDLKYKGEDSQLIIGSNNTIREYVTLQTGTAGGGMKSTVGDGNLFMVNSHLGHDSSVGNSNVIANSVAIAGHVTIGNRVTIGGLCGVHQFVRIADYAMIAAGTMATLDIPPACIGQGFRVKLSGINTIGLKRAGFDDKTVSEIRRLFRTLFLKSGSMKDRINSVQQEQLSELGQYFVSFTADSPRGVAPGGSKGKNTNPDDD